MTDLDPRAPRRPDTLGGEGSAAAGLSRSRQFRAGGKVLTLFSSALHGAILRALADGPVPLAELRARSPEASDKALRGNIGNLIGIGALGKRRPDGEPDVLDNELTPLGRDLLHVAAAVERWLGRAPATPIDPESEAAREAVKALVAGWNSTMLRALVVHELSLSKLSDLISAFSYPALERRLLAMRDAALLRASAGRDGGGPTYAPTAWMREAAAPLLASIRCERRHLAEETAPLARLDVETLFLLSVPLLGDIGGADGSCQLAVELDGETKPGAVGVTVSVSAGAVVACSSALDGNGADRASGDANRWLDAIVEGDVGKLSVAGDGLPSALVEALHGRLYAPAGSSR